MLTSVVTKEVIRKDRISKSVEPMGMEKTDQGASSKKQDLGTFSNPM